MKERTEIEIKIDNTKLGLVNEYHYLGIFLDSQLKFTSHIKMLKNVILYRMSILRKVRWLLNINDALILYKSILPYFDLGNSIMTSVMLNMLTVCRNYKIAALELFLENECQGTR